MDPNDATLLESAPSKSHLPRFVFVSIFLAIVLLIGYYIVAPTHNFPTGSTLSIKSGETLTQISRELEDGGYIRSKIVFQFFTILEKGDHAVVAGDYYFKEPTSVLVIAHRFVRGSFGFPRLKVTLPEGMTAYEMSKALGASSFLHFDQNAFLQEAKSKEGYLFPDTYFFSSAATAHDIFLALTKNFDSKIQPLLSDITSSGKTLDEIVKVASIVEKEAAHDSDRALIAGILWHRLSINMPLQVDASLAYVTGKTSEELTVSDLHSDSPYNLYTHNGLPPGPISNPGFASLEATVHPEKTEYLFFLYDKNDIIHVAKTFTEHKANKATYL